MITVWFWGMIIVFVVASGAKGPLTLPGLVLMAVIWPISVPILFVMVMVIILQPSITILIWGGAVLMMPGLI